MGRAENRQVANCLSKLGINTLRLQSGQKGEFSGIQNQRRLRCRGTAESSDKEKQSKLGLLMLGSPGKVFRLSGTQQAQAMR